MSDPLLQTGSRIGKYEILRHIASGGMAEVYQALDPDLNRTVALKVLPYHLADDPHTLERFRREARHAARLDHKNVVTLYEWGQDNGTHFLVMEYVEGTDLHNYIASKGKLDPQEAWVILVQAVRALEHACRMGITHRDIKPSNLLLSFRTDNKVLVKLTDLGLARGARSNDFRVTRSGTTVGTLDYMAPEQARDSALADVRSDIYSLGCTLYHMLAGQPPFPEGGLGERVYQHQNAEVPDVRQFNRHVPTTLWIVLRKMLEKSPSDRYQSAEELLQVLLHLHDEPAIRPSGHDSVVANDRRSRSTQRTKATPDEKTPKPHRKRWRLPAPEVVAATPPPDDHLTAEERTALGQYERARVVLATDNQDLAYAHKLLSSCCHLEPANLTYRKSLRQVAQALYQQGRWTRWLRPWSLWSAKARFNVARAAGDHRRVLEHGEGVLLFNPEDIPTQRMMADSARSLGYSETAIWMLEQLCKQDPEDVDALRLLARAYEKHNETEKALAIWSGILKLVPYDLEASRKADKLAGDSALRRGRQRH